MLLVFFLFFIGCILTIKARIFVNYNKNNKICNLYIIILGKFIIYKKDLIKKNNKKRKNKNKKSIVNVYNKIKKIQFKIKKLDLNIQIDANDPIVTALLVFCISNIITILLNKPNIKIKYNSCQYEIEPIYINKKIFNFKLYIITEFNLIHLIKLFL